MILSFSMRNKFDLFRHEKRFAGKELRNILCTWCKYIRVPLCLPHLFCTALLHCINWHGKFFACHDFGIIQIIMLHDFPHESANIFIRAILFSNAKQCIAIMNRNGFIMGQGFELNQFICLCVKGKGSNQNAK